MSQWDLSPLTYGCVLGSCTEIKGLQYRADNIQFYDHATRFIWWHTDCLAEWGGPS